MLPGEADRGELFNRPQVNRLPMALFPGAREEVGREGADSLAGGRARRLRLPVSDEGVGDEFDHARRAVAELLRERAEEHVLSGRRDRNKVRAELWARLERERPLEE